MTVEKWTPDAVHDWAEDEFKDVRAEIAEAKSGHAAMINWWLTGLGVAAGVAGVVFGILHP